MPTFASAAFTSTQFTNGADNASSHEQVFSDMSTDAEAANDFLSTIAKWRLRENEIQAIKSYYFNVRFIDFFFFKAHLKPLAYSRKMKPCLPDEEI